METELQLISSGTNFSSGSNNTMPKLIRCGDTVLLLSLPFTERKHTTTVVCTRYKPDQLSTCSVQNKEWIIHKPLV